MSQKVSTRLRIVDARWAVNSNILKVECSCGRIQEHSARLRWCLCRKCKTKWDMLQVKANPGKLRVEEQLKLF